MKKLIVFDLDGTLALSKSRIDDEMGGLLASLLKKYKVSVISGWDYPQFEKQFLANIKWDESLLKNLYICPTCGTKMFTYLDWNWVKLYSEDLTQQDKSLIVSTLEQAIEKLNLKPVVTYWDLIEDRWTQITYSALGQKAPLVEKQTWDPDFNKRKMIKSLIDEKLSKFSVLFGGTTSIDVTNKWVDKSYGMMKLKEVTWIDYEDMLFMGDALMEWGNDYPVKAMWVDCIQVDWVEDTKKEIQKLI